MAVDLFLSACSGAVDLALPLLGGRAVVLHRTGRVSAVYETVHHPHDVSGVPYYLQQKRSPWMAGMRFGFNYGRADPNIRYLPSQRDAKRWWNTEVDGVYPPPVWVEDGARLEYCPVASAYTATPASVPARAAPDRGVAVG